MTVGEAGERLKGDKVLDRQGKDHEVYHGVPYELHFSMEPNRELSETEAERLAYNTMQRWVNENPDHRVHYVGVRKMTERERTSLGLSSPSYEAMVQVTTSSPQLVAALITAGLAALGVAVEAFPGIAAAVGFISAYAVIRAVDYIFGRHPVTFTCPKNPNHGTFKGVEDLTTHLETQHPDQPETNKKILEQAERHTGPSWGKVALYGGVAFAGAFLLSNLLGGEEE